MQKKISYTSRIQALQSCLFAWKIDGLILDKPIDIFYLLGLDLSTGRLLITSKHALLLVDGRYLQAAKETCEVPVEHVTLRAMQDFFIQNSCKVIGFDAAFTTVQAHEEWQKKSALHYVAINSPLQMLRRVKDSVELEKIRKSAALNWKGFCHIVKSLKDGITESEVAFSYEMFVRQNGAERLAFSPIIAFGENGAMPHYHTGNSKLKKGQSVLVDIGVTLDSYQSDMTRIIFWGDVDPKLVEMKRILKEAYSAAEQKVCAGVKISELDEAARAVLGKYDMEDYFLHSLGHGLGLEVHEFPRIKKDVKHEVLHAGEVITIEPGIYIAGFGGLRFENTLIVTEKGSENLYPEELPK